MTVVGESWPVRIGAVGAVGISPGTLVWKVHEANETRVTVVVRATFNIVPEGVMTPREPDALVSSEAHHHADTGCSLRAASDLSPYLAMADVLLTGHAYGPPGHATQAAGARLVLHREGGVLITKTISVQGDRRVGPGGQLSEADPFQRMPLLYERAVIHPDLNPVGADPGRGIAPNLIHTADASMPGCFGPLARRWPARARLLGGVDPRQVEGTRIDFPQGFAWDYFQVAPPDQRTGFLRGDEGILLGGMHPSVPMVRSRLPGAQAVASVYLEGDSAGERLPLWADTLVIDTDRQVCSLIWRGNFGVDESQVRSLRIRVGLELPGAPIAFPGEGAAAQALLPRPPPVAAAEEEIEPVSLEEIEPEPALVALGARGAEVAAEAAASVVADAEAAVKVAAPAQGYGSSEQGQGYGSPEPGYGARPRLYPFAVRPPVPAASPSAEPSAPAAPHAAEPFAPFSASPSVYSAPPAYAEPPADAAPVVAPLTKVPVHGPAPSRPEARLEGAIDPVPEEDLIETMHKGLSHLIAQMAQPPGLREPPQPSQHGTPPVPPVPPVRPVPDDDDDVETLR